MIYNLLNFFRSAKVRRQPAGRNQRRNYQAAARNRLNIDWPAVQTSPRGDVYRDLRRLRARVRFLARNSDHFKKFLSMVRNNVAGPHGMVLQVTSPNLELNQQIELAWQNWSHPETASVNRRLSFTMILRRLCTVLARDGEFLVRQLYPSQNLYGYALKFYDVAWLDEQFNDTLTNGHRIVMSVEIDVDDRPVAYWLTPPAADFALSFRNQIRQRTRVPAEEIFHCFLPDDENCGDDTLTRGVPWGHTAATTLFNLDQLDEAGLFNARAGASKMGFFKPPAGDPTNGEDDDTDVERATNQLIDHFEPGTFWEMPAGYDFQPFNPEYPHAGHDSFAKYMLRRIASGLDVSYVSLANDLEGVNFSSIRAGLQEEREIWKALQEFVIETFARPVFLNWLKSAVLAGAVTIPARELDQFREPKFQARRWDWVDPLKDIQAKRMAIEAGLDTITDALAERGHDIRETFDKRRKELDLADQFKIPLAAGAASALPEEKDDEDTEEKPAAKNKKRPGAK